MRLTFLGTRGNIETITRRHRRHSALLVSHRRRRVMIDCGADWLGRIEPLHPHAIAVTHAHPDHAWGLRQGAPCPVYATAESWRLMADYPIAERRVIVANMPLDLAGLVLEAFPVDHSPRAPAVGYRVAAGTQTIFYVPDVVALRDRAAALADIDLYIGDGATLTRPLVRRRADVLFGHTTVRAQLGWCRDEGVRRALFTHCGTEIVAGDERKLGPRVRAMGRACDVDARIAYDGFVVGLP